jgi:hypothetical protein
MKNDHLTKGFRFVSGHQLQKASSRRANVEQEQKTADLECAPFTHYLERLESASSGLFPGKRTQNVAKSGIYI